VDKIAVDGAAVDETTLLLLLFGVFADSCLPFLLLPSVFADCCLPFCYCCSCRCSRVDNVGEGDRVDD